MLAKQCAGAACAPLARCLQQRRTVHLGSRLSGWQHCDCRRAGWILFLVFAGWGIFAAPIDWIFQYIRRPKSVITKSEYIERARGLAQRAKEIKVRLLQTGAAFSVKQHAGVLCCTCDMAAAGVHTCLLVSVGA